MDRRETEGRREADYSDDRKLILYRLDQIDKRMERMSGSFDTLAAKVSRLDRRSASLGFVAGSVPAVVALIRVLWK